MMNFPFPYIQNHINWCWATSAKIVGLDYCIAINRTPCCRAKATALATRSDLTGLRPDYVGYADGQALVDAMQQEVVLRAKDSDRNPDGNMPESDEGKLRALRYIITGDELSSSLEIVTRGYYRNTVDLLTSEKTALGEIELLGRSFIGNYIKHNRTSHSVVLQPEGNHLFTLYDPWDGFTATVSKTQLFQTGFLTNQGSGIIQWIHYIR